MALVDLNNSDYWFIPLIENYQLCDDINEQTKCEIVAENLLGNRLKREQLNFMYDKVNIIFLSPGKDRLFVTDTKKMKMINLSIPQLIILKSLERMHQIHEKKLKEIIDPEPFKRCRLV